MPRLIIRKSALSTTHYCRRWFPVTSGKNQRRKASEDSYRSDSDGRWTDSSVGRGRGGEAVAGGGGGGGGKGLISAGLCVLLNICRWFRRSRCACLIFLLLFFTFTFYTLTSEDYEFDDEPDDSDRQSPVVRVDAPGQALPQRNAINAGNYRLSRPNCNALEDGDEGEIRLVEDMLYKESRIGIPNHFFRASTTNCSRFRELRNYAEAAYSVRELQTPLAYVIGAKQSAEQVERLLRATYAPQNVYCVYSLRPTMEDFTTSSLGQALQCIAGCFTNIIVASGGFEENNQRQQDEVAPPYRVCLNSLLAYSSWRYVLLVAEGDFPLQTNRQTIDGVQQAVTAWRTKRQRTSVGQSMILPPLNKGNDYSGFVLTRKMAQFAVRRLANQDELNGKQIKMHAQAPRSYPPVGPAEFDDLKIRLDYFCPEGKPCALTSSDLHWLLNQPALFARRFDLKIDYVVIGCMENRLRIINSQIEDLSKVGALEGPPMVRKEGRRMGRQEGHQDDQQESRPVDRQEGHKMGRQKAPQMGRQEGHQMGRQEDHQMGRQDSHIMGRQVVNRKGRVEIHQVGR